MTENELQELSRKLVEKLQLSNYICRNKPELTGCGMNGIWLHNDLATVMRLAIEREVTIVNKSKAVFVKITVMRLAIEREVTIVNKSKAVFVKINEYSCLELLKDHPSRQQAVIVAVMKALLEVETNGN